jgi:hypothetical protein
VWHEHLLPSLELREAVVLRATCKAMRALIADMPAHFGEHPVQHLKAMLTCFPKARTIIIREKTRWTRAEADSLIGWLHKRGNSLVCIQGTAALGPFARLAWRAGLFKGVKSVTLRLQKKEERALIVDGAVSGVESLVISLSPLVTELERGALGCIRHFPALKDIRCRVGSEDASLPPFIPPSLEALHLDSRLCAQPELLLGCLPAMIESSGAKVRVLGFNLKDLGDEATARGVRSLIQSCASTVREITLESSSPIDSAVEVAEGLASCQHLEKVVAPARAFGTMPRHARGSITFRLVHLRLSDGPVGGSDMSSLELWGVMARGGFPVLQSLLLQFGNSSLEGAELGPALVAAFAGVAGTLKALMLRRVFAGGGVPLPRLGDQTAVVTRLGEAIGKLRRLETLKLLLGVGGVGYHRIAQGLGEGPCPALRSLTLLVVDGAAWMGFQPSLILPSVQHLTFLFAMPRERAVIWAEPLFVAHALTSLEYRGSVVMPRAAMHQEQRDQIRAILQPRASVRFAQMIGLVPAFESAISQAI